MSEIKDLLIEEDRRNQNKKLKTKEDHAIVIDPFIVTNRINKLRLLYLLKMSKERLSEEIPKDKFILCLCHHG